MARRRKKNPLLMRILLISIVVHAIALPIAARFGAFEKIQKEFGTAKVVMITTPPLEEKKIPAKAKPKPTPPHVEAKKAGTESKRSSSAPKTNFSSPKVLAATAGPGGESSGPTVDANGSGKVGELPTPIKSGTDAPGGTGAGTDNHTPPPPNNPPKEVVTAKPPTPLPPPPPPAVAKKFVQVETSYAPEPVIPDDLRTQALDATTVVEADVSPSGNPENIRIASSSGTKELDDIGLDTAKKYRFKPATLGDEPVEGHVRFRIIFRVE
jgi:protein TonB